MTNPIPDYTSVDATTLAQRVRDGELHPTDLVDAAIAAIEEVDPKLNAVVHRMYEQAREAAAGDLPQGPFRGVPMVVKDFDGFVKDVPFTASTRFLDGYVPDHDSEAMARLRRAGLVFLAKTNLPELAIVGTTESAFRGPARSPWNTDHSTGGSSGGSAALVGARAVPVAHGGDGGGSLRIPASHCGLVGLKATRGRVPVGPDLGEGWGGYVQWGTLTRSVRDTAAMLDVMAGPMEGDPYYAPPAERPFAEEVGRDPGRLRIAFTTRSLFGKNTHPECAEAVQATARKLEALGHHVEEACPDFDRVALAGAYLTQVAVGIAGEIEEMERWTGRRATPAYFEPATWFLNQVGRSLSARDLLHARDQAQAAGRLMGRFHRDWDVFITPTVATPPVRIGELAVKSAEKVGLAVLRAAPIGAALRKVLASLADTNLERTPNTQLFNQTGQPAISLPLHWTADGLPVGVQMAAAMGGEATLLRLASQIEQAHPWLDRLPAVMA